MSIDHEQRDSPAVQRRCGKRPYCTRVKFKQVGELGRKM